MKKLIFRLADYNIAGYEWTWEFYLVKEGSTFVLSCRRQCEGVEAPWIAPETGLKSGTEIYWALWFLTQETRQELSDEMLPSIARQIETVSSTASSEFLAARAPRYRDQVRAILAQVKSSRQGP